MRKNCAILDEQMDRIARMMTPQWMVYLIAELSLKKNKISVRLHMKHAIRTTERNEIRSDIIYITKVSTTKT